MLRNEIIQKHLSHKNLPLVCQTTSSKNDLINILQQISSEKFLVCDFNREEFHGNGCCSAQAKKTFENSIP
ncbi:MAG: hypothetical protein MRJ67_02750 [Nitrospirales bacterium]|nr:hypothetical protein [Nitrospirales bacterium]MDR4483521.1 hypothetical protein [Nitrospirales bacterium]